MLLWGPCVVDSSNLVVVGGGVDCRAVCATLCGRAFWQETEKFDYSDDDELFCFYFPKKPQNMKTNPTLVTKKPKVALLSSKVS